MFNQWWEMIKDLFENPLIMGIAIVLLMLLIFQIGIG